MGTAANHDLLVWDGRSKQLLNDFIFLGNRITISRLWFEKLRADADYVGMVGLGFTFISSENVQNNLMVTMVDSLC